MEKFIDNKAREGVQAQQMPMSTVIILIVVAGMLLIIARQANLTRKAALKPNPNANEPDVFASPEADLDVESDTGEPKGWN